MVYRDRNVGVHAINKGTMGFKCEIGITHIGYFKRPFNNSNISIQPLNQPEL